MGTKKVTLQTQKHYSEDFKRYLVKEYEKGRFSVRQLSDLHHVSDRSIYKWIYQYSFYNKKKIVVVEMGESNSKKLKDMEQRIKELERNVGQKQIMIEYLEKMIDLAKEHYDIDIKKNFATPPSNGSLKDKTN